MRIEINPVSKPRMTQRDKWAKRPCVVRYYGFKDELRRAWGGKEVPDQINLIFYLQMPSGWSKKRRNQMLNKPHQQKPDIDNLLDFGQNSSCKRSRLAMSNKVRKEETREMRRLIAVLPN